MLLLDAPCVGCFCVLQCNYAVQLGPGLVLSGFGFLLDLVGMFLMITGRRWRGLRLGPEKPLNRVFGSGFGNRLDRGVHDVLGFGFRPGGAGFGAGQLRKISLGEVRSRGGPVGCRRRRLLMAPATVCESRGFRQQVLDALMHDGLLDGPVDLLTLCGQEDELTLAREAAATRLDTQTLLERRATRGGLAI